MWNRMKDEQVAARGPNGRRGSVAGSRLMATVFVGASARRSYICAIDAALQSSSGRKPRRKNQEVPNSRHPTSGSIFQTVTKRKMQPSKISKFLLVVKALWGSCTMQSEQCRQVVTTVTTTEFFRLSLSVVRDN